MGCARRDARASPLGSSPSRSVLLEQLACTRQGEVNLVAHAAVGAGPVVGHLAPGCARGEALARVTALLVVGVAAAGTAPATHRAASALPPPALPPPALPPPATPALPPPPAGADLGEP